MSNGSYVGVKLLHSTKLMIQQLQQSLGLKNPTQPSDLHMTLMYSKVDFSENYKPDPSSHTYFGRGFVRLFGEEKNVVVLELPNFTSMITRHKELEEMGGVYTWDDYRPHITLSYDEDPSSINEGQEFFVIVDTSNEYYNELDEDW